jgi:pimeloyl-ACP methyl ester carboxylesterase
MKINMSTFVLVPGAWLGAWVWRKITPILRSKGHDVYTVTLTGMGDRSHLANRDTDFEVSVQDAINVIEYEDLHDVILVGHSFAGKVVAAVQDRIPGRIKMLFLLDAFRPQRTRSPQGGIDQWNPHEKENILQVCDQKGDGWLFPLTDETMADIGYDMKGEDREWFLSKVRPLPIKIFFESIRLSENIDHCRMAYIFCLGDNVTLDEAFIKTLYGDYRTIISGHWPMVTKPEATVEAMLELTS